jgi:hypothetical protein
MQSDRGTFPAGSFVLGGIVKRYGAFSRSLGASRWASLVLLVALFWIAAAATYGGFAAKFALCDQCRSAAWGPTEKPSARNAGFKQMIDGTARKPWVYRQLAPMIANAADRHIPSGLKQGFSGFMQAHFLDTHPVAPGTFFAKVTADAPDYHFRYMIVFYLGFLSAFATLFVLRAICLDLGAGSAAAIIAPMATMLAYPYVQTNGGYVYDYIELLFTSLAFLLAYRRQYALLILAAVLGTLNKESLFFFMPALYPVLRLNAGRNIARLTTLASIIASGLTYVAVRHAFQGAPGGSTVLHLMQNLRAYTSFWSYHELEATYGIIGPSGMFAGTLLLIAIIVQRGWADCPARVKQHLCIAALINVPLFLLFCAPGELRDLSLVFVGFVILAAFAVKKGLA